MSRVQVDIKVGVYDETPKNTVSTNNGTMTKRVLRDLGKREGVSLARQKVKVSRLPLHNLAESYGNSLGKATIALRFLYCFVRKRLFLII